MTAIRILLADGERLFREGLAALFAADDGFHVAGEAGDGAEAARLAGELLPDVAVLDAALPGPNGVEAARMIVRAHPEARILALSREADGRDVAGMFQAGATGYVLRTDGFDDLAEAVRTVAAGGSHVSGRVAGEVIRELAGQRPDPASADGLSGREREVLRLLAEGRTSKESALLLHVSAKTIDSHRRQIMRKLGIGSVAELTKYAVRHGLTSL